MARPPIAAASATSPIPLDDPARALVTARPDAASLPHVGIVGDTYTILLSGRDTAGRFTLIDMHVPPGGGPGPHRHDFEETFSVLEGEIELTCRGAKTVARAGDTVNVPANAPHSFRNVSSAPARLLCICAPAGQEEFFLAIGVPLPTRTAAPPPMDDVAMHAFLAKAAALAPRYRTELLGP
jgi:quercetin dioxygenase-like cupin family protein